jgi:hypothetical protein
MPKPEAIPADSSKIILFECVSEGFPGVLGWSPDRGDLASSLDQGGTLPACTLESLRYA